MITDFEGTEADIQEAITIIKTNKDQFEKSNVNFLKFKLHKGMGWINRLLNELESRNIVSSVGEDGRRKVVNEVF